MLDALAAAARALTYAGILTAAGAVFAQASLWQSVPANDPSRRHVRNGALLVIGAVLGGTFVLIFRLGGQFNEPILSAVFASGTGAALLFQLAGAALLLAPAAADDATSPIRLSNAALLTGSLAINGHAASAGLLPGILAFIHVSAAAWWVGSLLLLRAACRDSDPAAVADLVKRFSGLALKVIAALATAGLILLLALVDVAHSPWLTTYGQVIAMKLVLVAVVLALASYNRWRLSPRLYEGDRAAVPELRRMVDRELVVIGAILAVTAILTTFTAPESSEEQLSRVDRPTGAACQCVGTDYAERAAG
jgi:putative copper export protein